MAKCVSSLADVMVWDALPEETRRAITRLVADGLGPGEPEEARARSLKEENSELEARIAELNGELLTLRRQVKETT